MGEPSSALRGLAPGTRVVLFDGVCRFCAFWARFLLRFDRHRHFMLATVQSSRGQALLEDCGLPLDRHESVVLIEDGRWFLRSTAALRIVRRLPLPWSLLSVFWLIPRPIRDWVYDRIADNRYRWFGRYDECPLPDPALRDRFLGQDGASGGTPP